ncbi:SMC5-SMC6 complex localization factor protein 2 [Bagarius yarrelli]|uniref:SMC5-SMC6 complex localization factor protein 2 n=1 Tax=Bagarius yarrelli TaxID=175774 RepID=A0A556V6H6_BAGYA|nr:SMC5-SMC6 complex localization factor protein 2 [Bagarius yarrelli]
MQSNLRQHITSMVKDIIPLGGPRQRTDNKRRVYSAPQCSSEETNKKHEHTLKPLNPLLRCTAPRKRSVLKRRNGPAGDFSLGSKKTFVGAQERVSNYREPVRNVQFNNNSDTNNIHSYNEKPCQSAAEKVTPLQRDKQKEFAFAFCKQLTENLKVGKPVVQIEKTPLKMPSAHRPLATSFSAESHKAAALPISQRRQTVDNSVIYQNQMSIEKTDKPFEKDQSTSSLSPVEHMNPQATTPADGRSLSLKRRRDSSAEIHEEGKRLCQEEMKCTSSSTTSSLSAFSSPPQYIKRAFLKRSDEPVLTLKEKCSPTSNNHTGDRIKVFNNVAKQLFEEPRTESHKLQTATLSTMSHEAAHQKQEIRSSENKCFIGNSFTADSCTIPHTKLPRKQEDGGSPASSHTSLSLGQTGKSECSSPLQQPNVTSRTSLDVMDSHNSKTSLRAGKDVEHKNDLALQDPLDLDCEFDEGLGSCVLSLSSSQSSEEDQLLSLKEIMARSTCVPATPDKMTFSAPSTPGPKLAPEDFKTKATSYKNTLEQMLKEKEQNQKSKELEMQLLEACKEDLLKLEEKDETAEEEFSHEQREFLQRFSVSLCIIRDIHPGEEVFTLTNSGRLFNHLRLDLRKMGVTPNNRAQQTLLEAHSEQFLPLLSAGLFRRAYSSSPCQPQVTRWLFQMMSVQPNPIVCAQILQALTTIALSAAQQLVEKSNLKFKVWVPSLQDVALVFLNMGASFVSLFPLEALQPSFTEGDLLESLEIQPDSTKSEKEADTFPEHNFENIIKYLALCAALCPKAYSNEELLLLLTVVCRVSLETHLQLLPTGDISCLLQHLLNNMTDWEMQMSQVCQVITNLSEDHHNLRRLVQLLPHCVRGRQLRKHVSVSIISKLLNHGCTYTPSCTEFQLSDLRVYLPRMRPSLLLKGLMAAKTIEPQETDDCVTTPDQQAYYLCYSLLALTNEASNFEFLPSSQRNELLLLSTELEKHVKCDIRESEKMLYRSKVKDFVARIYTKWQVLLQRSRPQEGKLYDNWIPLAENEMHMKEKSQFIEQKVTKESVREESDTVQSDEEECMEVKEDVSKESKEQLDDIDEKIQENIDELQEVLADIGEKQHSINPDEKEAEVTKDFTMDEDLLGTSEGSLENHEDKDLIKRKDELLRDDKSLDRNENVLREENDELGNLELLEKYVNMLNKTNEEALVFLRFRKTDSGRISVQYEMSD